MIAAALALNDRCIRVGDVEQLRAPKHDVPAWLHGVTVLTLRPIEGGRD